MNLHCSISEKTKNSSSPSLLYLSCESKTDKHLQAKISYKKKDEIT